MTLDAGPLIAFERCDRRIEWWVAEAERRSTEVAVPASVVAEVWRGGPRAARVARALRLWVVTDVDDALARRAGELLAATGSSDTLDAIVVADAARRGDLVLTSDPNDVAPLARAAGVVIAEL